MGRVEAGRSVGVRLFGRQAGARRRLGIGWVVWPHSGERTRRGSTLQGRCGAIGVPCVSSMHEGMGWARDGSVAAPLGVSGAGSHQGVGGQA